MKRIILDHLKRWGLVWIAIGIFNFAIVFNSFTLLDQGKSIDFTRGISFPILLWISAFALNFDLQRGSGRVLTTLPVTARQIGRSWWIVSVALPTLFLAAISGLAMLIHFAGSANGFPMDDLVVAAITYALYLGSFFYLFIGPSPGQPQNAVAWLRVAVSVGFIVGMLFVKPAFNTPQGIIFLLAAATLTVTGWFRAEQMVLQRASFKLVAKTSNKNTVQHKIPQDSGGLPYLVKRIFIQSTLIGLGLMAFMILLMSFFAHGQDRAQSIISMVGTGSTPYVFYILMFSIIPIVFQLRFLRTLPIPPSTLAATFVFLPIFSVAAVGVIVIAVAGFVLGQTVMMPTTNNFLMLAAKAAIIVPLIVWRGLETPVYILIFLLVLSDSFISLGMTIIFHLGSKSPDRPWWVNLSIFLLCLAMSLMLTRKLLTKSSSAYRVRTMPTNTWSMARR
jgi:hypothetical protein